MLQKFIQIRLTLRKFSLLKQKREMRKRKRMREKRIKIDDLTWKERKMKWRLEDIAK